MRLALFYHSLISDWNHDTAHFLRGVVRDLLRRGHDVRVFEPADAWSVQNLVRDHGETPIAAFHAAYPMLSSRRYDAHLDLDEALDGCDVAIVHEWNDPTLVARIGAHRKTRDYVLLFHDTHHRSITAPDEIARYDLRHYDGVLAFGRVIRDLYLERHWARRAWTWHEAADVLQFRPQRAEREGDVVWIGNWDDERSAELHEMLLDPIRTLGVRARVHGVRYPAAAQAALASAGIAYGGWLASFDVPAVFARHAVTVHLPLPGIPTIRPFEALACGIPLVSAPWHDDDQLFEAGSDYLLARDGAEMTRQLRAVLAEPALAAQLSVHGRKTVLARHTCSHRVAELLSIVQDLT